jgi:2,5-furandicarboxylate decarboxylase 1
VERSRSLGSWLDANAGALGALEIAQRVDPMRFQATAFLEHLERAQPAPPPVLFTAPRTLHGDFGEFNLLFNAFASLPAVSSMLDIEASSWPDFLLGYVQKMGRTATPRRCEGGPIPVQENVRTDEDVDLRILPWVRHVTMDGGPYFTPIVVARSPEGQRYNLSWNRCMFLDQRHIAVHISPRDLWSYQRAAEEKGNDLRVALVLGHHPAFNLGAAALTTRDDDEYDAAATLMGGELVVAPSVSYGEDLLVPADAEVVVEGRLLAGQRAVEGPFGEYLLYVGPQKLSQVLEVDALTWRRGATVVEIFTSHIDHLNAHIAIESSIFQKVRAAIPQVVAISWFRGGGPTTMIISVAKSAEGQPMRAALAAMAASNIIKQVIVVDDDVDIENSHEVLWAVSTRSRADEDITVLHNLQGNLLDPSQTGTGKTSGFVIDATKPLGVPFPPVARVPGAALDEFPMTSFSARRL